MYKLSQLVINIQEYFVTIRQRGVNSLCLRYEEYINGLKYNSAPIIINV